MFNIKKFYEEDAKRNISENTKLMENLRYKLIISKIPKKSKKVFDVGCGNGDLVFTLAEKGHNCIALDISRNRLNKFKEIAKKNSILQIQGCANNIPLNDMSVDAVICSEILEHIKNYKKVLKEIHRILKLNGKILISVPYKEELTELACPNCYKKFIPLGHIHSFDENKLFPNINYCGFTIKYIHKGPTLISRFIYKRIKVPLIIILLIDNITGFFGLSSYWLIIVAKKKNE